MSINSQSICWTVIDNCHYRSTCNYQWIYLLEIVSFLVSVSAWKLKRNLNRCETNSIKYLQVLGSTYLQNILYNSEKTWVWHNMTVVIMRDSSLLQNEALQKLMECSKQKAKCMTSTIYLGVFWCLIQVCWRSPKVLIHWICNKINFRQWCLVLKTFLCLHPLQRAGGITFFGLSVCLSVHPSVWNLINTITPECMKGIS